MKDIIQKKLHGVVNESMKVQNISDEFATYQSVLSMLYTLIEDGKLSEVDIVIKFNFPQYYHSPVPLIICNN